jgi:type III pantothenate kinase
MRDGDSRQGAPAIPQVENGAVGRRRLSSSGSDSPPEADSRVRRLSSAQKLKDFAAYAFNKFQWRTVESSTSDMMNDAEEVGGAVVAIPLAAATDPAPFLLPEMGEDSRELWNIPAEHKTAAPMLPDRIPQAVQQVPVQEHQQTQQPPPSKSITVVEPPVLPSSSKASDKASSAASRSMKAAGGTMTSSSASKGTVSTTTGSAVSSESNSGKAKGSSAGRLSTGGQDTATPITEGITMGPSFPARDSLPWLSLVMGNSRLSWAVHSYNDDGVEQLHTWRTEHLKSEQDQAGGKGIPTSFLSPAAREMFRCHEHVKFREAADGALYMTIEKDYFYVASVVLDRLSLWQQRSELSFTHIVGGSSSNILSNYSDYPQLGIDRALALRGAGSRHGWPVAVIDCGTAMTITKGEMRRGKNMRVAGGAILPGLKLQAKSLHDRIKDLPDVSIPKHDVPEDYFPMNTPDAIRVGICTGLIAAAVEYVAQLWESNEQMHVVVTGGDCELIYSGLLRLISTERHQCLSLERDVLHVGISSYRNQLKVNGPEAVKKLRKPAAPAVASSLSAPQNPHTAVAPQASHSGKVKTSKGTASSRQHEEQRGTTRKRSSSFSSSASSQRPTGRSKVERSTEPKKQKPAPKPQPSERYLNKQVCKKFGDQWFVGKITEYFPASDSDPEDLWHCVYEDGDEEDFTTAEARKAAQDFENGRSLRK